MKLFGTILVVCSLALASPAVAAQPDIDEDLPGDEVDLDEDTDADTDGDGDSLPLIDDGDDGTPGGAEENPDDPGAISSRNDGNKAAVTAKPTYPLEYNSRPISILTGMSELSIDIPVNVDPFFTAGLLQARYGVTDIVEIGMRYGLGALDEDGFTTGKTLAVEATYVVTDFVGVRLSLPILLDPFAMGVTIGAPMQFDFGKLRFALGHDLLSIKLAKFVPDVGNALATDALVAGHGSNTTMPDGDIRLLTRVSYQHKPNMAFGGESGVIASDFSTNDMGVPLYFFLVYSASNKIDLGGRVGFSNLDEATKHAGLSLFAALRI